MAIKSQIFSQFPWIGGLNLSVDPGQVPVNQLVQADNVVFATSGSRKKREGIDLSFDNATASDTAVIGGFDFWWDTAGSKNQRQVIVKSDGKIEACTAGGVRTEIGEASEVTEVTTVAKGNFSDADYFTISSASGTDYYVWYDTTGSAIDPSVSGRTGIEVSCSDVTTASDIATRTASAVNASSDFSATASASVVTITDQSTGPVTHAASGTGTSDFSFSITAVGASNWDSPTKVTFTTFNNRLVMAADKSSNKVKIWDGSGTAYDLEDDPDIGTGTPPNASVIGTHLGRLWLNEKDNPDRVHYSETFNHLQWGGYGDSGAIDIGLGDGDPSGVTAFFPTFKGALHIGKKTKLYRIVNNFPETFQVIQVSNSLGCISQATIATVDETDIIFASVRGVHSLVATDQFGDFNSKYLSADIQRAIVEDFSQANLDKSQAAYISQLNSYVWTVSDTTINSEINNALYLYNIPLNSWYRWTFGGALSAREFRSVWKATDSDRERIYIGTDNNKIGKTLTSANSDINTDDSNVAIELNLKTGLIPLDGNIYSRKAVKRFSLVYKPTGTHSVTVSYKLDDYSPQSITYSLSTPQDLLGSSFVLGTSALGASFVMNPQVQTIEGYGRVAQFTFSQSGIEDELEIQGFQVEYVPAGRIQQTTLTTGAGDT